MPRQPRNDTGNQIYHVINRANARIKIFESYSDYELFELILMKAIENFSIKLFSHSIMSNHFHLVILSEQPNELPKFMQWLSLTFTQRWHTRHNTTGTGHLFQGRYKSFPVKNEKYLLQVLLYSERNPKRGGLVERAEEWRWSSAWIRLHGTEIQKKMLTEWPIEMPKNYLDTLNEKDDKDILEKIRFSISKNTEIDAKEKRPRGRPKKGT